MYESATAMNGLSCFINVDLARDLANDIMTLVRRDAQIVSRELRLIFR